MCADSYTSKECTQCVVYDQWMGTKARTANMPHNGPSAWPSDENRQPLPDRYGQRDMNGTDALDPPVFNAKGRRRYLGGSAEFADRLRSWLQEERRMSGSSTADAAAVTAFHAQAAATLTMLQMALE